jgi:hypothetical protein
MPDNIERERLKKKMLDRWENEGGRIAADSVIASQSNLASPTSNQCAGSFEEGRPEGPARQMVPL